MLLVNVSGVKRYAERKMSWTGGDWLCGACQHANFKKRDTCQKCGYPKFGGVDVSTYLYNRTEVLAGDWYCGALNCGSHNYASRTSCYRCGMIKVEYTDQYYGAQMVAYGNDAGACPPGWKTGDWVCPRVSCAVHNYASRAECFKCKTTRDYGKNPCFVLHFNPKEKIHFFLGFKNLHF